MELFTNFISEYGVEIMYAILTFIAGWLGTAIKKLATEWFNNKIKQAVATTCVKAIEQIYKDLHGSEKLDRACEAASQMLAEKGIAVSDLELRMLIESALAEFNEAFRK
jgi:hypothetical protein